MPLTNWYSLNWITNDYKSYVTRQQSTMKQLIRHRTKCCQLVGQCRFQYWWITDFEMLLVLLLSNMYAFLIHYNLIPGFPLKFEPCASNTGEWQACHWWYRITPYGYLHHFKFQVRRVLWRNSKQCNIYQNRFIMWNLFCIIWDNWFTVSVILAQIKIITMQTQWVSTRVQTKP